MFIWFLRILSVASASWLSYVYIVKRSGGSLSPLKAFEHGLSGLWLEARNRVDEFEWLIFSPLAVGFVLVAFLAYGLMRTAGR